LRLQKLHGRGVSVRDHFVQFFDSNETRCEAVARFLAAGHRTGSSLLVIARPSHWIGIQDRLGSDGVSIQRQTIQGRVIVLDARETLHRISRNGIPDAGLFDEVVGTVVARLAALGPVCAYCGMVDLQAERADYGDAVLLERFWNRIASRESLSIMCGYSAAHFVSDETHRALRDICSEHSAVRTEPQDPLAVWLLSPLGTAAQ
jgi:hypothetical protein